MQAQQLSLRDIHLPDTLGWWPPAIGWWILVLLIPLFCWAIIWLVKRLTRKTALKMAKKIVQKIKQDSTLDNKQKLLEISALIRRVAISISPRSETASLTGQAWLEYLDSSVKGSPFTQGVGQCLADRHYQNIPTADLDIPALLNLCDLWLKAQKENKK